MAAVDVNGDVLARSLYILAARWDPGPHSSNLFTRLVREALYDVCLLHLILIRSSSSSFEIHKTIIAADNIE